MPIRLIVLDLDGTTIGDDFVIPARVATAVRAACERGIAVTLATGRSYAGTRRYAEELGLEAPLICYQGGAIVEAASGAPLYSATLPSELVSAALDLARANDWYPVLYDRQRAYVDQWVMPAEFYEQLIHPETILVPDLRDCLERDIAKFLFMDEPERIPAIEAVLREHFGERLVIVRSHARFVEGNPPGVSKGSALELLAGRLSVARAEVLAIGDSDNDVSMLTWAGVGVAMGQGTPAARAAADWIAPPFAAGGAAVAIERFALNGQGLP